jgi:hypothetical protein
MIVEKNSFKDTAGRQWTFRITAQNALDLKNEFGFDIRDIEKPEKVGDLVGGDLEILNLMGFVLLKQLEKRGMTATQLFEDMTGDEVADACWAFVHGCIFFFPSHTREPLLAWASRVQTIQTRSGSLMTRKVQSREMDQEIDRIMMDLERKGFQD